MMAKPTPVEPALEGQCPCGADQAQAPDERNEEEDDEHGGWEPGQVEVEVEADGDQREKDRGSERHVDQVVDDRAQLDRRRGGRRREDRLQGAEHLLLPHRCGDAPEPDLDEGRQCDTDHDELHVRDGRAADLRQLRLVDEESHEIEEKA